MEYEKITMNISILIGMIQKVDTWLDSYDACKVSYTIE